MAAPEVATPTLAAPGGLPASEQVQPQELVITMLGTYVRPFGGQVWSGGLVVLLGQLGFSHGAARVALTRLVNRALLDRVREGRLVHYRITPRADRLLAEGDTRIFSLGHPRDDGGTWTLLWHTIPAGFRLERSRLARRLRFLGFGSVQDSLWVSPHDHSGDVAGLLAELGVSDYATLFTEPDTVVGLSALVARAGDGSGLVDRYDAFDAEFSPLRRRRARRVERSGGVSDPYPARAPVVGRPSDRPRAARVGGGRLRPAAARGGHLLRALRGARPGLAAALRCDNGGLRRGW